MLFFSVLGEVLLLYLLSGLLIIAIFVSTHIGFRDYIKLPIFSILASPIIMSFQLTEFEAPRLYKIIYLAIIWIIAIGILMLVKKIKPKFNSYVEDKFKQ